MSEFSYLSQKIRDAEFIDFPFQHLTIERFLSDAHFERIVTSPTIKLPRQKDNRELIDSLLALGYEAQDFPGCITDISEYIQFANGKAGFRRNRVQGYGRDVIEGYGITMRLKKYRDDFLASLVDYMNGEEFQLALREMFDLEGEMEIETAIQKNLNHYEISPHCDTSRKALTYMVNIYTDDECENLPISTHLLRFKPEYHYLYDVWKYNKDINPVWVPWNWCDTVKMTVRNNSVTIFKPSHDTLHAVKLDYDHLRYQRNQIYGNLWYPSTKATRSVSWQRLDIHDSLSVSTRRELAYHFRELLRAVKRSISP
jgi:hypothetical protein